MEQRPTLPNSTEGESSGFFARLWRDYREDRRRHKGIVRGTISQQKALASSPRQAEFAAEVKETIRQVRNLKVQPTRVETFEAAVQRRGLSLEQLRADSERHKRAHLALYCIAGALFVYAFWLLLNVGIIAAVSAFVAAAGGAVNGYLHGFRAWQIEHRQLIRLQDAVRIPSTYLVL